jgi:hypothetical protein
MDDVARDKALGGSLDGEVQRITHHEEALAELLIVSLIIEKGYRDAEAGVTLEEFVGGLEAVVREWL